MRARVFLNRQYVMTVVMPSDWIGAFAEAELGVIVFVDDTFYLREEGGWVQMSPTDIRVKGLYTEAVKAEVRLTVPFDHHQSSRDYI